MEEFSTFQRPFSQEQIEFLLEMAKANMVNNKETVLREISKATLRKRSREESEMSQKPIKLNLTCLHGT